MRAFISDPMYTSSLEFGLNLYIRPLTIRDLLAGTDKERPGPGICSKTRSKMAEDGESPCTLPLANVFSLTWSVNTRDEVFQRWTQGKR